MHPIQTLILETVGDRLAPSDVDALAKSDLSSAREEARARANEAKYLADASET